MRSVTTIIYANYMCCGVTTAKHNGSHKADELHSVSKNNPNLKLHSSKL